MNKEKKPVICLMGPTASGKTELAVALCEHLPLEIISVDSVMIYRGMDIGTAKPSLALQAKAPHRLIDIRDPDESYSAAEFCRDATREIHAIFEKGKIPLLVGGTFLYFKALMEGLADLPSADKTLRDQLFIEGQQLGWPALHRRLAEIDPIASKRIHPHDQQRIQRALEVYELTGKTLTDHYQQPISSTSLSFQMFILFPADRHALNQRIEQRFRAMIHNGLIEEVKGLQQHYSLTVNQPSMRAVGYRQVWQYLAGEYDKETLVERGIIATRQYAKRQLTWLRRMEEANIYDELSSETKQAIIKKVREITYF